jgi:hypothetical protein
MSSDSTCLVAQALRHLAIDDTLGQAFDDGGFADARLADQYRVVFGAALRAIPEWCGGFRHHDR